jgi:hypothetical protein
MYKIAIKLFLTTFFGIYIFLLYLMASQLFKLGLAEVFNEIFPAIDIIIIYYFSSYNNIKYWLLLPIGMVLDQSIGLPLGTNSLAFIFANLALNYANKWFILKDYLTNILAFCVYSLFIMSFRYLIFIANYKYSLDSWSLYFYYLTTILSYPLLALLIYKPSIILDKYAR